MSDQGFGEGRERVADYISICDNLAASYPLGLIHGFQKDAIQNALDARAGRAAVQVEIEHVVNGVGGFLLVTDTQTTGLTGPYVTLDEYDEDLPEDYHWARFEGFAFTKQSPDALGACGQGKFILMKASTGYLMYYDTLRADGVYRFGGTKATRKGCPVLPKDPFADPWEDDRGRRELSERCGLEPLTDTGTRIIIVAPRPEHVEALRSGELAGCISETWFRAIEKKRLEVNLVTDGKTTAVNLERPYPLPSKESGDIKLWVLGSDFQDDHIDLPDGTRYKVKRLEIARLDSPVAEDMQGVAIMQGDMKIESRPMSSAPPIVAECVAGYIEFDSKLDGELRKGENQYSNHYALHWRSRIPRAIKAYVEKQMADFGAAKLGLGADLREERRRRQSAAEEAALREISHFAQDLDIFNRHAVGPKPPPPPPPAHKLFGVAIHGFAYPDPDTAPRVAAGASFEGLSVEAYNRTEGGLGVLVAARVLRGGRSVQTLLVPQTVSVPSGEKVSWPLVLRVGDDYAEPGDYRLEVTMDDVETGERMDEVAHRFWVDVDPPFRAPFDARQSRGFPGPYQRRQWTVDGYIGTATVYYNVLHPAYLKAEQADELQGYLREIFIEAAIELVLNRPDRADSSPDYHPLDGEAMLRPEERDPGEVPLHTYQEIMRYVSDLRWRVSED